LSNPELEIVQVVRGSARQIAFYDSVNILKTTELVSGTTGFYEQDGLASVTSLTNGSGAAANTYTYDSFGNLTASSGTLANPFQYTGREWDPETGIYGYRARYYDPNAGRFVSEDPIGFAGGINRYSYVGDSPLNFIDPFGLCPGNNWAWNFTKSFIGGFSLSIEPGTCLGVFADTTTAPLKQLQSATKYYIPLIVGAIQSAPSLTSAAGNYIAYVGYFTSTPADETAEAIAGVSTVGAAATVAAPYVSAAAPYVVPVGGDAVLLNGVIKEVQSGMSGQCSW